MAYTLEVKGKFPSLNEFRNNHYFKNAKLKRDWHEVLFLEMKSQRLPKPLQWPTIVSATVYAVRPTDADGTVIAMKFFLDSLVEGGYLPDDKPEFVPTVILTSVKAKVNKVVFEIKPV